jgi:hypothetical protein
MAKTDSFFIRESLTVDNSATFQQTSIDLGAFVDALGKSVLRVHNISVMLSDSAGNAAQIQAANDSAAAQFQLTTQTQSDIVLASDKSVIASGIIYGINAFGSDEFPQIYQEMDMLPQAWTNGYLVGVETIYLGGEGSAGWVAADDLTFSIVLECTVETLNEKAAMALALSQQ